jgi:carbon-monoxide dehydrogenase medium subunit
MVKYDYLKPASIGEAIELLQRYGKRAILVAGGTDVMVGIRQKKSSPQILISLKGVNGLDFIKPDDKGVGIGSLSTHRKIAESV